MNEVFEKITKTFTDTSKVVTEKTKQVSETAKLHAKITSSENTISTNYTILGKYYYETYKENPDEAVATACGEITAAMEAIDEMKAQILSLKGIVKCDACGAECPIENNFCGKCGAVLEKPEPIVEEAEEAIVAEVVEAVEAEETIEEAIAEESAEDAVEE